MIRSRMLELKDYPSLEPIARFFINHPTPVEEESSIALGGCSL